MTALLSTTTKFERVAKIVAEKVAQLLSAAVFVIDLHSIAIASSDRQLVGLPFKQICKQLTLDYLTIPIYFDTQVGEVIICKPHNGEEISPRLAQVIVDLIVNQIAVIDALPSQHQLK